MFRSVCVLVLLVGALARPDTTKPYRGHSVVRVTPKDDKEVDLLKTLLEGGDFDVWKPSNVPHEDVDIRVAPAQKEALTKFAEKHGLSTRAFIHDVQDLIDEEQSSRTKRRSARSTYQGLDLEQYHSLSEITAFLAKVASDCSTCSLSNSGQSIENRDMPVLKIGSANSGKRAIFIDCGIHAREWVSPATCLYIISQLTNNPDAETTALLNHFDFYIMPVANPDGYEYSRNYDRLWRKNRRPSQYRGCAGADLNRNFGYYWGVSGTSTDPCSEVYGGSRGFSEPESQNIRDFVTGIAASTDMYVTFHAYGQLWLNSWGYTRADANDAGDIENVGEVAVNKIRKSYRTRYQYGSAAQVLYASAGGSDDWAKGGANIKYSYTVELRDTGRYGFVLPARLIMPTATEAWAGLKVAAQKVQQDHPNGTR